VQATLDSAPDLRRSMKKMKKIIQTISGIALGLLVSVAVFFIGQMIATQIFFWADAGVHPMWVSAPSAVLAFFVMAFCLRLREYLLRFDRVEAWTQRVIIGLFVLPVLGAITWWCGTEFPF
jgi:hypothetical protein